MSLFVQGTIATGITQPVDVMKTRLMEAKPGQYKVKLVPIFTGCINLQQLQCFPTKHSGKFNKIMLLFAVVAIPTVTHRIPVIYQNDIVNEMHFPSLLALHVLLQFRGIQMFRLELKISPQKSSNCGVFTRVHDYRCCILMKNCIFGLNIIFLCYKPVIILYHSQKSLTCSKTLFFKVHLYLTADFLFFLSECGSLCSLHSKAWTYGLL